jgi:hypothetical protein
MTYIIGISGKKQAGKDELCKALLKHAAVRGIRIAFADAVKEEVAKACGVTTIFVNTNKERFRPILQWWGTDFRRYYAGDNYWVEKAFEKITNAALLGHKLIIIPDVRFLSEAQPLTEGGAFMVRISRPIQADDTHISETELDSYQDFDEIVLNNGTIADLETEAINILRKLNIPIQ